MICDGCGIKEALDSLPRGILTSQERTRVVIVATRNTWDREELNATHDQEV